MKRLCLTALLLTAIVALLLTLPAPASAASSATAKRLAKKLSPVKNPFIYDVTTRDMRKQGARGLWVHYLPLGGKPAEYANDTAPDGLNGSDKPKLGFGLLVNKDNQVIVDYYLDRKRVFSTGGALDQFASWQPLRDGQPLDQRNDPAFRSYDEAISKLSFAWGVPLYSNIPGYQLRQIMNFVSYRFVGSRLYLSVFTGNSTSATIEIVSPTGKQALTMVKRSRPTNSAARNPGVQEWQAKISLRKGSLFGANNVDFRVSSCNTFGCFTPGPDGDWREIWRWDHKKATITAVE